MRKRALLYQKIKFVKAVHIKHNMIMSFNNGVKDVFHDKVQKELRFICKQTLLFKYLLSHIEL